MDDEKMTVHVRDSGVLNKKIVTLSCELETDQKMIDDANLGRIRQSCKICGAEGLFQTWRGIEMFVGLRDVFRYFECPKCQSLQIETFPDDIGKYYAHAYYSFEQPVIHSVQPGAPRDMRMILDVGCGAGEWLCFLASIGCVNLFGCDPFISNDLQYRNGVKIFKRSIHEMDGAFDVIHLSHSFEHMPDPHEVFQTFSRLLKKKGARSGAEEAKIEITIPVFRNIAFDVYGPFWYQMDPPRHYFLHSEKSITMLAEQNGFYIEKAEHQMGAGTFYISRLCQLGVPFIHAAGAFNSGRYFADPRAVEARYTALANAVSALRYADVIAFTLKRV